MLIRLALSSLALLATLSLSSLAAAEKDVFNYEAQRAAAPGTKRIVFIATRGTHGGRGNHEFLAGETYLARRINEVYPNAYAVVYPDDKWPKDLSNADAIIVGLNHGARAAMDPNIKAAAERGAGFMAIHFGVEVNKGEQGNNYLDWMGGYFETFWSVNPTWEADIREVGKHPAARGVKPFKVRDEWYYHMRFREGMKGVTPVLSAVAPLSTVHFKDKPSDRGGNADVLKAVEAGEPQHLAWAGERPGGGRGFGFTGMHYHWNWAQNEYRRTVLNALVWIAGGEVPAQGVASKTPTMEQLEAELGQPRPAGFNADGVRDSIRAMNP